MKRIVQQIVFLSSLLLFIVACGGGGHSTSTQNSNPNLKEFKVKVNIPNSVSSKSNPTVQKTDFTFEISRVTLTVKDKDGNPLFEQPQEMVFVNGVWSATLLLDETKAPFTFIADGYDSNGVKRYTGTTQVTSLQQSIVLSVSRVLQGDDNTILVPYLKSITSTLLAGGEQRLNVTVVNKGLEDIDYNITAIPEICEARFEPPFGVLTFKSGVLPLYERGFTILVHEGNETCAGANYRLNMKTASNQVLSVPLILKDGAGITVNFPPKINSFNFTQEDSNMIFKAEASDAEGGDITFEWEEVIPEGEDNKVNPVSEDSGENSSTWIVEPSNLLQSETLMIQVKIIDDLGAFSIYRYKVKNSNPTLNVYKYPIKKTGQVTSYVAHDDGAYQKGVTPSYTRDATKEVVLDNIEGWMWQDDSDVATKTFADVQDAKSYCSNLTLGGYSNWSLPSVNMLINLVDYNTSRVDSIFVNRPSTNIGVLNYYVSETPNRTLFMNYGSVSEFFPTDSNHVRCVRPDTALLMVGSLTRSSIGIVTDERYGLDWQDEYNGTIPLELNVTDAINYCENLQLGGFTDWRLPNIKEFITIMNYFNSANGITFYSVFQNNESNYWTSTLSDLAGQGVLNPMLVFSDGTMQVGGQGSTGSGERCVRDH